MGSRKPNSVQHLKKTMLDLLAQSGNVSLAAREAGIDRSTHYAWLRDDVEYAKGAAEAMEVATDALEAEARRRGIDGVTEPTGWYQGRAGGYVQKYSDTLLIFLLKGARPEKYRDRGDISLDVVRDRLRQTLALIRELLPSDEAERLIARLDPIWR